MTTPFSGLPARVQTNLPTAKGIVSTTLATPIVVTTASPHGLSPGDYFAVYSTTDVAAKGIWKAGTCTSTTVVLLVPSTGADSVGVTGGGAAGALAPAGFGVTAPILSDGDAPSAALWNTPYEAGFDRLAWLWFSMCYALNIKAGGVATIKALGTFFAETGSFFDGEFDFISSSVMKVQGRRTIGPRVAIADGDITINVTQGYRRSLVNAPAGPCTVTIDSTVNVPKNGEVIEVVCVRDAASLIGDVVTFKRDDASSIAAIIPSGPIALDMPLFIEFEFTGGAWEIGRSSPLMYDGTANYGVQAL